MRALNAEHRGLDEVTDVLAFPMDGRDELPPGLERQLGDVVVCFAQAEQAGRRGGRRRRSPRCARSSCTACSTCSATTTRPTRARCSRGRTS